MSPSNKQVFGQDQVSSGQNSYNALHFMFWQLSAKINTMTVVKVQAVTNSGGVSAVGFVDVLPLVNQLDGKGKAVPHKTVYHLPYFRLQGGADAIILDPKVGDIGMAGFCNRDISSVKSAKKQSNPGSYRRFDMSDGLYFGGFLNGTPEQYIAFTEDGIKVVSPTKIIVQAPEIDLN